MHHPSVHACIFLWFPICCYVYLLWFLYEFTISQFLYFLHEPVAWCLCFLVRVFACSVFCAYSGCSRPCPVTRVFLCYSVSILPLLLKSSFSEKLSAIFTSSSHVSSCTRSQFPLSTVFHDRQ